MGKLQQDSQSIATPQPVLKLMTPIRSSDQPCLTCSVAPQDADSDSRDHNMPSKKTQRHEVRVCYDATKDGEHWYQATPTLNSITWRPKTLVLA